MIRSLATLFYGIILAALIVGMALLAAVYIIGLATKAMLFGKPKATVMDRLYSRLTERPTDITHITPNNGKEN